MFDLQAWVETHDSPFLILDETFRVVAANRAYERVFARSRREVEGRPCYEVAHQRPVPCDQAGEECPLARARTTGLPYSCLHTHYDAVGEVRWVRVHLYPITAADGMRYYAETVEEIAAAERPVGMRPGERRLVGRSRPFLEMVEALTAAATFGGPILLMGEAGTSKELAARFIHGHSARASHPFFSLDCAAVGATRIDRELFGDERGGGPGSGAESAGMVELAHGSTLFLDEIDDLSLAIQAKLLRLLESREVQQVGSDRSLPVDVRIIAAARRPLWEAVTAGLFREELFHRLACFTVELPPLRDRFEDLPLIIVELLRHLPPPTGIVAYRISRAAVATLRTYSWPGNVDELRELLQVAAAAAPAGRIEAETIVPILRDHQDHTPVAATDRAGIPGRVRPAVLPPAEAERLYLADALARHQGHRRHTASALGMSERTLYRKLKRYGLGK